MLATIQHGNKTQKAERYYSAMTTHLHAGMSAPGSLGRLLHYQYVIQGNDLALPHEGLENWLGNHLFTGSSVC